jgi:branched-chain amino acid transport system substrate-binding protein
VHSTKYTLQTTIHRWIRIPFNALGYDLAKFLADGIKRAEKIDGESIKNALAATENFQGVTGSFSVDENHNPVKAIVVVGLKDGVQASSVKVES